MIDLPDYPSPVSASPGLVDFGAFLTPSLGGPVQRVERMGTRFRIAVTMPPLQNLKGGRQWVAKLIRGKQEGARMEWPLGGFDVGSPGAPVVFGAGQSGRSLYMQGVTPRYIFREGQFFSIEVAGQHFLHMVTAEVLAGADTKATVPIEPMLRRSPPNGAVCHFGRPMVEGFIVGEAFAWDLQLANFIGLSFDLVELE